jgi:hypothetical protein
VLRLIHTYHAVPLPCRAAKGFYCVFPIWFTQCGRVWFTHAIPFPCHATTMPFWKRPLKATAQRGMGTAWYMWISIGRPATACGRPARVRLFPATTRSSTKVVTGSRLAVRIFPSTTRTFTKDTALWENGRVAAWHVWINAAGERHGMCELALTALVLNFDLLKHLFSTIFNRDTMFWKMPGFPNKGFDSV